MRAVPLTSRISPDFFVPCEDSPLTPGKHVLALRVHNSLLEPLNPLPVAETVEGEGGEEAEEVVHGFTSNAGLTSGGACPRREQAPVA
jgi:hypothetical protein